MRVWFYVDSHNYRRFFTTEKRARDARDIDDAPLSDVIEINFTKAKLVDYLNDFAA